MERRESRRSSLAFSNQFSTASAPDDARTSGGPSGRSHTRISFLAVLLVAVRHRSPGPSHRHAMPRPAPCPLFSSPSRMPSAWSTPRTRGRVEGGVRWPSTVAAIASAWGWPVQSACLLRSSRESAQERREAHQLNARRAPLGVSAHARCPSLCGLMSTCVPRMSQNAFHDTLPRAGGRRRSGQPPSSCRTRTLDGVGGMRCIGAVVFWAVGSCGMRRVSDAKRSERFGRAWRGQRVLIGGSRPRGGTRGWPTSVLKTQARW